MLSASVRHHRTSLQKTTSRRKQLDFHKKILYQIVEYENGEVSKKILTKEEQELHLKQQIIDSS
jgi:hypothetical protein